MNAHPRMGLGPEIKPGDEVSYLTTDELVDFLVYQVKSLGQDKDAYETSEWLRARHIAYDLRRAVLRKVFPKLRGEPLPTLPKDQIDHFAQGLRRAGHLNDVKKADRWLFTRVDSPIRRAVIAALFPTQAVASTYA